MPRHFSLNPYHNSKDFDTFVQQLVDEGRRVGKVPWCADSFAEMEASWCLNHGMSPATYPQESMQDTCVRRMIERGVPSEIISAKIVKWDQVFKG